MFNDRMKLIQQKNNSNVKHLIQKIRVLRAFNKNIVPQKKKNVYKNNIEKNMKEYEKAYACYMKAREHGFHKAASRIEDLIKEQKEYHGSNED